MRVEQLHHILRASAEICEEIDFVIVGSQAILGEHPEVTEEIVIRSTECDLYPAFASQKSELLNVINELSPFHTAFGYYADGVDETTATFPEGWKSSPVARRTLSIAVPWSDWATSHERNCSSGVGHKPRGISRDQAE
jgi:hypothetical protein